MANAVTADFSQIAVKLEDDPPGSGTFSLICGITARTINQTNEVVNSEVPDCADESLPLSIEKGIRSSEYNITGNGVYDKAANVILQDWFDTGAKLNIQIEYLDADTTGDIADRTGPAILTAYNLTGEWANNYTAEITIEFNGTPVTTLFP